MRQGILLHAGLILLATALMGWFSSVQANDNGHANDNQVIFTQQQKDEVLALLRQRQQREIGKSVWQSNAETLKPYGDAVLWLLAEFLTDYDLGLDASETMLALQAEKAAPLIFQSMPKSNRNVQYHTFRFFIRSILNRQPFAHAQAMHDAAVRCLDADTNADAAEQALLAIGLIGNKKDFPLLEKHYHNQHPTAVWRTRVRNASEAALARLGHAKYLHTIVAQLEAPVPARMTTELALSLNDSIRKAAFANHSRFIPLLCRHLHDPIPAPEGDTGAEAPAQHAANALGQLVNKASPDKWESIDQWKAWCDKSTKRENE